MTSLWKRATVDAAPKPTRYSYAPIRPKAVSDYLSGDSAAVVSRRYGVARTSVLDWVRDAGHKPRPHGRGGRVGGQRKAPEPDRAVKRAAVKAYLAGSTINEVAVAAGVNKNKVSRWVREAGHETRSKGRPTDSWPTRYVSARVDSSLYMDLLSLAELRSVDVDTVVGEALSDYVRRNVPPRRRAVAKPAPTNDRRHEAIERYLAGEPSTSVGVDVGVSPSRVLSWVREEGHEVRPRGRRPPG